MISLKINRRELDELMLGLRLSADNVPMNDSRREIFGNLAEKLILAHNRLCGQEQGDK